MKVDCLFVHFYFIDKRKKIKSMETWLLLLESIVYRFFFTIF